MKRSRPSGSQQRKIKKSKDLAVKTLHGSILKYVAPSTSTAIEQSVDDVMPLCEPDNIDNEKKRRVDTFEEELDEKKLEEKEGVHILEESERQFDYTNADISAYLDVANWPIPVPADLRADLVKKGSEHFQNKDGPFDEDTVQRSGDKTKGKVRHLNASWFYKPLPNGENVLRKWMVYSIKKHCLYCFCCKLFSSAEKQTSFVNGFNSWWKLNPKVAEHETSEHHLSCLEKWKTLAVGLKMKKTIDHDHILVIDKERKKWRDILHRLLDVILFLAHQNLPFRGHREGLSLTAENKGNFLELVILLSKYDPVLKEHMLRIEHTIGSKKRVDTYLSKDIQNEFINLLGIQVKNKILDDIKKAKYFGVIFDSTPDVSHVDQMSQVIRYVHIEGDKVEVKESFLAFFPISGKTANELTENILKHLESDNLDIHLCRAQGYDNAATMAGVHGGVQKNIKEINPKALFMPCANHSLNLCGVHSFGSVSSSVTFFGTLERVYTFFSTSTHRWELLMTNVGVSVKRLAETRWSAHHDATRPIKDNFEMLVSTLELMCDPNKYNVDTRGAASTLLPALCDFSFLCHLAFWCEILEEVNHTQKYLQTSGLTLEKCATKMRALKLFLQSQRNEIVQRAISYATQKCEQLEISMERRGRKKIRKMMPGEEARDAGLTLSEEIRRAMFECMDRFSQELEHRCSAMDNILVTFGAIQPRTLLYATNEELVRVVPNLTKKYDEFTDDNIISEIGRLRRHLEAASIDMQEAEQWTSLELLRFIVKWDFLESLPNLSLSIRFFLTICVSVASCERSFSKLKCIKSYLRSNMSQARLTNLAILSIEKEEAKHVNFEDVIDHFSKIKARKHI